MKSFLKKTYPHFIALGLFLALSSAYFSPAFNDYELKQGDVKQYLGMQKEISDFRMLNDEEPLWTNAMFGGMPAYQISIGHSGNILIYVDKIIKLGLPQPVGMLFMAMVGFYILALCLRVRPWIGMIGAVAFGFSTINILYLGAGHITKINAITYMAPALGGLILAFRGRLILGAAIFSLFLALNLSANHFQMSYYLVLLLAAVSLAELIRLIIQKEFNQLAKTVGILAIAGIIAPLPSIGNVLTTLEYSEYTTRGGTELTIKPEGAEKAKVKMGLEKDYILEYNYGKRELLSIIAPGAQGERGEYIGNDEKVMETVDMQYAKQVAQMNKYWGGQRMSGGAFYFGVIILVFALFGLIFLKDSLKWPFLVIGLLCLLLATNNPGGVNDFFINKFPMYNKFRDSKMILVLLQVLIPTLGILFLEGLIKKEGLRGNKKTWLISGGAMVFIGILLYASPRISGSFISKEEVKQFSQAIENAKEPGEGEYLSGLQGALKEARIEIYKADMGRAAFLIFLACGLIIAAAYTQISKVILIAAAGIMVTADNMSVCKRYLHNEDLDEASSSWVDVTKNASPYLPNISDVEILNKEKASVSEFNAKVNTLYGKMEEHASHEHMTTSARREIAEFGVLNLNTDFRVLSFQNPFNETNTSYFHKSIGGYHGAKLKRYQEMIDFHIGKELQQINQEISAAKNEKLRQYAVEMAIPQDQMQQVFDTISVSEMAVSDKNPVLNMLNTKYIIPNPSLKPVANTNANGNAWFVEKVIPVNSANDEMSAIYNINSHTDVIVNEENIQKGKIKLKRKYSVEPTDNIKMTNYGTKVLTYQSNAKTELPAVFSEIYYPEGWNFYIDGRLTPSYRANYVLRGALIPSGKHKLEWKFEPESYQKATSISWIGSLALMLLILFASWKTLQGKIQKENNAES